MGLPKFRKRNDPGSKTEAQLGPGTVMRRYPCGCVATGGEDLPEYCPEHSQTAAPKPAPAPTDRRGTRFDARIHARDETGKPKEDSLGHFILAEHDYVTPRNTHYPDSFRHAPKDGAPDAT